MKQFASKQTSLRFALFSFIIVSISLSSVSAQEYSSARVWNEMVLNAIRNDFARPTVHARNLHHTSIAMYDAFAAFDDINEPYLLGKTIGGYTCEFTGMPPVNDIDDARRIAISYAVYRLIEHRFKDAPGKDEIFHDTDLVFSAFGYDREFRDSDYSSGDPAALGNYIAESLINYGYEDGSNEIGGYENTFYEPVNPMLNPFRPFYIPQINFGNERLSDPNRWQQLTIPGLVDQNNIVIPGGTLPFLSAEWGNVTPFSLTEDDKSEHEKEGNNYNVYHDPGPPHYLDTLANNPSSDEYKWGFSLVTQWKTHILLDSVFYDISPASVGNIEKLPETVEEYKTFYNFQDGGDASRGYDVNPRTGLPYEPQLVQRADYTRVLAEWWADGPESETPPGHWFTILNYVNDQDQLIKKYKGEGIEMTDLEWDVKSYFTLAGAMHDAAISAWSIKGFYDYIRPISAIRYMADRGQSSDPNLPNYDVAGHPLIPGTVEQILDGDQLLSLDSSNYGALKVLTQSFEDQKFYGILDTWTPYQPINFITPPFAGYVSGHSTFSRAAAEVLTMFTGDEFFPGGMGTYEIPAFGYLETQQGPTDSLYLQWATYRDAAHQSALSRIWGGIHPPIDDIPGRKIGIKVGKSAFELADGLFGDPVSSTSEIAKQKSSISIYPNPVNKSGFIKIESKNNLAIVRAEISDVRGHNVLKKDQEIGSTLLKINLSEQAMPSGIYNVRILFSDGSFSTKKIVLLD